MILIMPEDLSIERAQTMKAFGAELILTPRSGGMEYARDLALQMQRDGQGRVLGGAIIWRTWHTAGGTEAAGSRVSRLADFGIQQPQLCYALTDGPPVPRRTLDSSHSSECRISGARVAIALPRP